MKNRILHENNAKLRVDPLTKSYLEGNYSDIEIKKSNKSESDFSRLFYENNLNKKFQNEEEGNNSSNESKINNSNETDSDIEDSFEKIFKDLSQYDIFSLARHGQYAILECILIKGISPDSRDLDGNTILIIAAQNGNKRIIKIALRYGAQINMKNCNGNTALHYANEYNYDDVRNYLIKKGANPNIENIRGFKAYEGITRKAVRNKNTSISTYAKTKSFGNSNNKMFKFNAKNIKYDINNQNRNQKNDNLHYKHIFKRLEKAFEEKPKIV